jgi:cyclopropane fatty-acyl-phospholipid synthase-like methyltransferase
MYDRENVNFQEIGDIGEVWSAATLYFIHMSKYSFINFLIDRFGEDSVEKMADWVLDNVHPNTKSIIDLGCGNGHLLLALSENGFSNLHGIDYSESAIQLAKAVAQDRDLEHINYQTVDFLNDDDWRKSNTYDVVLDKGTYDAICLDPAQEEANQKHEDGPKERYVDKVRRMISDNGQLLITSCNWTKEELIRDFGKCEYAYIKEYYCQCEVLIISRTQISITTLTSNTPHSHLVVKQAPKFAPLHLIQNNRVYRTNINMEFDNLYIERRCI